MPEGRQAGDSFIDFRANFSQTKQLLQKIESTIMYR